MDALEVIHFFLALVIVSFHSIGCYVLLRLYRNGRETPHQVYLINLSITEGVGTFLGLLAIRIPKLCPYPLHKSFLDAQKYMKIVLVTVFTFVYYMNMIYITIDRLLEVSLNIKYAIYCSHVKTKWLLIITWIVGLLSCFGVSLASYFTGSVYDDEFFKYLYPALDFAFIVITLVSYSYIFDRFKKTRRMPQQSKTGDAKHTKGVSTFKVFWNSRFYISLLLISSFFFFVVVPDSIYLVYGVIMGNKSEVLEVVMLLLFDISYICDACIYIFAQVAVRISLRRLLGFPTQTSNHQMKDNQQQMMHLRSQGTDENNIVEL